jgi:hypothetical protein
MSYRSINLVGAYESRVCSAARGRSAGQAGTCAQAKAETAGIDSSASSASIIAASTGREK